MRRDDVRHSEARVRGVSAAFACGAIAGLAVACVAVSAPAADLYWSGTGTWNTTTANWGTVTGGPYNAATWSNDPADAAIFQGTAGTVTLGEPITAAGLTFSTTGYTVTGNTLTLSGAPLIATGTGISATIASTLAGTSGFTKTGDGTLTLSSSNNFSGGTTVSEGRIVLGNDFALGSGTVTLNGGSIERDVAGVTVANAITVGASGGTIVGRTFLVDGYTTLSGQLGGSGPLTVQGLVTLTNTTNTYSGTVTISNASTTYLRLAASEVLGDTAVLALGGASSYLRIDGGQTETIGGLDGTAGNVFGSGAGTARLKVASGTYGGTFSTNDSTFVLEKVGSGTLILNRSAGNAAAIGGVEVTGGTLRLDASGPAFNTGYFTGSQPITVRSGATLEVNRDWNTAPTNLITIDGGTLSVTNGIATDGGNYVNNLTLANGATVTGNRLRAGFTTDVTISSTGSATNTITSGLNLVNDISSSVP